MTACIKMASSKVFWNEMFNESTILSDIEDDALILVPRNDKIVCKEMFHLYR